MPASTQPIMRAITRAAFLQQDLKERVGALETMKTRQASPHSDQGGDIC